MPVMNFDLQDGKPPVVFSLKPEDCDRFMAFMSDCERIRESDSPAKRLAVAKAGLEWREECMRLRAILETHLAKSKDGKPCGECHLQPGERCDVCGALQGT